MMDELLNTFLITAEYKSFSKAADELYLTPNAIKKRIEYLEDKVHVKLFNRSNKGVELTKAGLSFYKDMKDIDLKIQESIKRAQYIEEKEVGKLYIGIMDTFSDMFFSSNWIKGQVNKSISHLVRYGTSREEYDEMFNMIGNRIDLAVDIYDEKIAKEYNLNALKISEFDIYLGTTSKIEGNVYSYLNHSTLITVYPERSNEINEVIHILKGKAPNMRVNYIDDFHFWTIQEALEKGECILMIESQIHLYPNYYFEKLDLNKKVSFGLYYSYMNRRIEEFIKMIKK